MKVLGEAQERLMAQKDEEIFVPMGKHKMKEWVLISKKNSKDYLQYEEDFISSLEYVLALSKQAPEKKKKKLSERDILRQDYAGKLEGDAQGDTGLLRLVEQYHEGGLPLRVVEHGGIVSRLAPVVSLQSVYV